MLQAAKVDSAADERGVTNMVEIIKEKYGNERKFVITVSASDYGMDATGQKDVSVQLQQAIEDCKQAGGGCVYLPEGKYLLKKGITVRTAVTIVGDWAAPNLQKDGLEGTVFLCGTGKGEADGTPQIVMEACSGLIGVICYYPEQSVTNPSEYPPTIRQRGVDSITVENVTLVNPWCGIQCGPDGNELHYLKNVYMSPLSVGFYMDMTTDIGRMEGLYISPEYYEKFCLYGREVLAAEEKKQLRAYMLGNATGVFMARSDWEYGYHIEIEGCKNGIVVTSMADIGPNTQLYGMKLKNCDIGIHIIRANPYGVAISDSVITADIPGLTAAVLTEPEFAMVLQCNAVDFTGSYATKVLHQGSGQASFVGCRFGEGENDIVQTAGGLSVLNCEFEESRINLSLGDGIGGAQVIGCSRKNGELIFNVSEAAKQELVFSAKQLDISPLKRGGHKSYPYCTQPEAEQLYNVREFGAAGDGAADDTKAFAAALQTAGQTGGIVYVPGGLYRITSGLTIPHGTELRGVFEVPCHTLAGGSVIEVCYGKGQEDGKPLFVLEGHCGIRGIVIHHPGQDPKNPVPYPWAVQARGERCHVVNTVFVNSWLGIDMGSCGCEEHYISYISGAPIRCGIFIGNNKKEGWVENIQYNPHYWYRSTLPNAPSGDTWTEFWHNQIKYLDALKFGHNENEHVLNTFVFAAKHGLYFCGQDGLGTSGTFIGHGTDGGEKGLRIDCAGELELVNTELVTIESPDQRIYIYVTGTAGGKVTMHNTLMWGAPHTAVVMEDGKLEMVQTNIVDQGERAIDLKGGSLKVAGAYFYNNQNHFLGSGGEAELLANMTDAKGENLDRSCAPIKTESNGGSLCEAWNWYK